MSFPKRPCPVFVEQPCCRFRFPRSRFPVGDAWRCNSRLSAFDSASLSVFYGQRFGGRRDLHPLSDAASIPFVEDVEIVCRRLTARRVDQSDVRRDILAVERARPSRNLNLSSVPKILMPRRNGIGDLSTDIW